MARVLHRRNVQIHAEPNRLRVVVPYWFGWPVLAFMVLWTGFSISLIRSEWHVPASNDTRLYIAWPFCVIGIALTLWQIFGRETVDLTQQSVTVSCHLFGVGPCQKFATSQVRDIRVGSYLDPNARGEWKRAFVRACICFEYRGKSHFVADEIRESDAVRILCAIRQCYPELAYQPAETPLRARGDETAFGPRAVSRPVTKIGSNQNVINPLVIGAWSLLMIWAFGINTLGMRLWIQCDGLVTASRDIPPTRGPRYTTDYLLRGPGGQETRYIAGPTDASLPRSMPIGTSLRKKRWHLYYERNGQRVDDFPLSFYVAMLTLGFGCLGWSVLRAHRQRT